ncbi:Uma2 family endonuclease [Sorangium cellulosum]|uniref:Uma2 family endonuclease n=1 Tax=Sorangium cellulosum TaxID=56 RepID=UPI001F5CC29D|nr:Uma2 family endonuclease [Sorangium cellulosum]
MEPLSTASLSVDEYIARERAADGKSEYLDGRTHAMAGGSPRHNLVAANLTAAIRTRLRGTPCVALTSDQRILIEDTGLYTYPDLAVVCGGVRVHPVFTDTVVNPTVLAEVLSPSTEAYDRGAKFAHYRRIESLREVLLVARDERFVERFVRLDGGDTWRLDTWADEGAAVPLESVGVQVPLDEIYEGLEQLPPEDAPPPPTRLPRPKPRR